MISRLTPCEDACVVRRHSHNLFGPRSIFGVPLKALAARLFTRRIRPEQQQTGGSVWFGGFKLSLMDTRAVRAHARYTLTYTQRSALHAGDNAYFVLEHFTEFLRRKVR